MEQFLDLCGQAPTSGCAFSAGSAAATEAKWDTLLSRLRAHPVTLGDPPQTFTYARVASNVVDLLFFVEPLSALGAPGWAGAAQILEQLWQATTPADPSRSATREGSVAIEAPQLAAPTSPGTATEKYAGQEQSYAVLCSESPNPRDPNRYAALAAFAFARSGDVGPQYAWETEVCATWRAPRADPYLGPWDRHTGTPILTVGNTYDPATPYQGSVAMTRDLQNARLLTVQGYGHTALDNPSTCVDNYESSYLTDGTLPPEGTVCQQGIVPFPPTPPTSPGTTH